MLFPIILNFFTLLFYLYILKSTGFSTQYIKNCLNDNIGKTFYVPSAPHPSHKGVGIEIVIKIRSHLYLLENALTSTKSTKALTTLWIENLAKKLFSAKPNVNVTAKFYSSFRYE